MKYVQNFAKRNDLILERYNLIGIETRFILDEYENLDPAISINLYLKACGCPIFRRMPFNQDINLKFNYSSNLVFNLIVIFQYHCLINGSQNRKTDKTIILSSYLQMIVRNLTVKSLQPYLLTRIICNNPNKLTR